ncbi:MAG: hypothetical protein CM1200mP10_11640 [Candidatus Neomarinimicrobiota bacterium]|nr:MAG: hypothetical protein CM1200mP10_11640 [Candidatus Neomarinimicrobiota bacterium]
MRYLGITWNNSTDWATSAKDETSESLLPFRGLTEFGKDVIKKCDELGVKFLMYPIAVKKHFMIFLKLLPIQS